MLEVELVPLEPHRQFHALARVRGVRERPSAARFSFSKEGAEAVYLGPDGWQQTFAECRALKSGWDAARGELWLVLGPDVVQYLDDGPFTFILGQRERFDGIFPPEELLSRGAAGLPPLTADAANEIVSGPAPPAKSDLAYEEAADEAPVHDAAAQVSAREASAREAAAREASAGTAAAREALAREAAREAEARGAASREAAAREAAVRDEAQRDAAAREAVAREMAARETVASVVSAPARDTAAPLRRPGRRPLGLYVGLAGLAVMALVAFGLFVRSLPVSLFGAQPAELTSSIKQLSDSRPLPDSKPPDSKPPPDAKPSAEPKPAAEPAHQETAAIDSVAPAKPAVAPAVAPPVECGVVNPKTRTDIPTDISPEKALCVVELWIETGRWQDAANLLSSPRFDNYPPGLVLLGKLYDPNSNRFEPAADAGFARRKYEAVIANSRGYETALNEAKRALSRLPKE